MLVAPGAYTIDIRRVWVVPMRPQRPQVFRLNAASRLDDVELIAALLERDATNNRVQIAERGGYLVPRQRPKPSRTAPIRRFSLACAGSCRKAGFAARRIIRDERLHAALREGYEFGIDFLIVLGAVTGGILAITGLFLVVAPPL